MKLFTAFPHRALSIITAYSHSGSWDIEERETGSSIQRQEQTGDLSAGSNTVPSTLKHFPMPFQMIVSSSITGWAAASATCQRIPASPFSKRLMAFDFLLPNIF
ncbi:hypothetical protein Ddc_09960 [Ditylenchus destructor]|nr:hypothetical protein Ddc_09960 [Ditylenchus destructor]